MELKTTFALSHPPTHIWMFGLGKMGKIGAISDENLHIFAYFVRVNAINKVYNASPSSQVSFFRFFFVSYASAIHKLNWFHSPTRTGWEKKPVLC